MQRLETIILRNILQLCQWTKKTEPRQKETPADNELIIIIFFFLTKIEYPKNKRDRIFTPKKIVDKTLYNITTIPFYIISKKNFMHGEFALDNIKRIYFP